MGKSYRNSASKASRRALFIFCKNTKTAVWYKKLFKK